MDSEVLHIGLREIGGTRVLSLTGELDSYTSSRLSQISETWINGAKRVAINLDGLQYIDSSGLSVLVRIWVESKDRGAQMVISCSNPRIHRILEITGLLKLFTIDNSMSRPIATPEIVYSASSLSSSSDSRSDGKMKISMTNLSRS